jgi:hypothetical protein
MLAEVTPWRLVVWTDADNREVRRLGCHVDELPRVLDLPFPPRAVVREPVYALTAAWDAPAYFSRRRPCPFKVGDTFTEEINQGHRTCRVVAVNDRTGDYLYDYEMPGGRVFLRNQSGRPVGRGRVPQWAREWLD